MSWTDDVEATKTFAGQGYVFTDKRIYITVVDPENILAIYKGTAADISNPNEYFYITDYVIDYQKLDIELIKVVIKEVIDNAGPVKERE